MDAKGAEIVIRDARPDEYDAVAALTVEVYVGEGYVRAGSPYVNELADIPRRAGAAQVLVAVHGDRVVGSLAVARPGTPYAGIARAGELEFRMLAVSKAARGFGAGSLLVRTVIELARTESFDAVVLTTMPAMVDARRLYDRFGFAPVPKRDWRTPAGEQLTVLRLGLTA